MMHSKWHWACCWKPMTSMVLWGAGSLALVMAWYSVWQSRNGVTPGIEPLFWYWNALVLGVLATGCKGGRGSCCTCDGSEEKAM